MASFVAGRKTQGSTPPWGPAQAMPKTTDAERESRTLDTAPLPGAASLFERVRMKPWNFSE